MSSTADALANPILNRPYDIPDRHFELGPQGPTGVILDGRRPSESFIPIPATRKGKKSATGFQEAIDFDPTGERRERNDLVNELRREVGKWRQFGYERVTPITRKLLQHWADETRENRVLFCQREAAETAIFLAEVAGRHGYTDWRRRLEQPNAEHNSGLPRVALKMATGSGKTVVMAMLIAWQTANKVQSPNDVRFSKRFLVVTPGITIKDRLRVLQPSEPGNYYAERDLVPPDLQSHVRQAQIIVTNYHAFALKDAKEIKGVASATRKILLAGKKTDPFTETPDAMVTRVLRDFVGTKKEQIVVFNDEAHHCYQDRPIEAIPGHGPLTKEEEQANVDARLWFKGLQAIHRRLGIKSIYDLSATPFYLGGSGWNEGYLFPWVVSDFSLMDAIESGIVKIPRTPVDDDAAGDLVTYLRLWDHIGKFLPKRKQKDEVTGWMPPEELEGALRSLHRSYRTSFEHWEKELKQHGEPPPVFIVVCPNTVVSKLVYDWIAGSEPKSGALEFLSNVVDGKPLARPRTILVDSVQLESGDAMKDDFKKAAASEIEAFKADYRRRHRGADADKITDEDLLREVMNTVGKPGMLGEDVRCVVSVAMLTEGWDANTVTHILGIRAFGSQLLCEQVVGRGLRRRSYAVNDEGYFEPEYANVYGIPFAFIPSDRASKESLPRPPAIMVQSVPGRERYRIEFPKLQGYRTEMADLPLAFEPDVATRLVVGPSTVPTRTDLAGIVGAGERVDDGVADLRTQRVAFELAKRVLDRHLTGLSEDDRMIWHFAQLTRIAREWLETCVDYAPGYSAGNLLAADAKLAEAAEAVHLAIARTEDGRSRLRPLLRPFDSIGDTSSVSFATHKVVEPTEKSEVSHVVLDGIGGNTWEQLLANACERNPDVAAYVKNDHLDFSIPYVHKGRTHEYRPDFLLRLAQREGDVVRTLIVEVSGGQKSPGPTREKAATARDRWCVAVNNAHVYGRWGYVEFTSMDGIRDQLANAIRALYDDAPIAGDPSLLDYSQTENSRAAS